MKTKNKISRQIAEWFHSQWLEIVHAIIITTLAVLFTRFIVYDLMSLSVFTPLEKTNDFQMSDIYQSVASRKANTQRSSDITIVSIDGCHRNAIMDAINIISEYRPSVIGLDILFQYPETDNSLLLSTLTDVPNIVCAGMFEKDANDENDITWHHVKQSFFEDEIDVQYGYVNLCVSSPRDVIRDFVPFVMTGSGDTLFTMPTQLAKLYAPHKYKELIGRNKDVETIAFEDNEFFTISIQDILSGNVDPSGLTDKVVLLGDVKNPKDTYLTPLPEPVAGVMLHAYALQTILSGNYIDSTPVWLNWLIAVVLCLVFTICNLASAYRRNLWVRIVQFLMMYLLLVIGSVYFVRHHTYLDFSPAILMIGFGAVAFDVWFGIFASFLYIKNKISKK